MQHVPEEVRQLQQVQQQDVAGGDLSPEGDTAGGAARRSMRGDAKAVRQAEASATTSSDGADKPSGPAPRRINRRLRPEVVDEMAQLHRSGCTVKEIAQQFGFHRETVATHLKRAGLTLRTGLQDEALCQRVRQTYQTIGTVKGTAQQLGISKDTVRKVLWVGLTSVTNMRIVMIMPSRNVYVAEDDVSLFTEASEIAGGLSAAVAEALRDYVKKHQRAGAGYEEIELMLRTDGVDHRVTFMGRRLVRVSQPAPEGTRIDTVYQTAKNQLAVATKIQQKLPDWAAGQENLWSHPETWDRDFWVAGDKTMVVYPDIEHLGQVDGALAERVESALAIPPFEVLDI